MDTLSLVAPYLQPYLTINKLAGYTYTYDVRTGSKPWQGVECIWHQKKLASGSWLYVATDVAEGPARAGACRLLYVGSQTGDRMFRGDFPGGHPMKGRNFHHAEIRNESGTDNLVSHLAMGGKTYLHVISGSELSRLTREHEDLRPFGPVIATPGKHVSYWFEQAILLEIKPRFAWNVRNADAKAISVLRAHGWY